jgi:hypothetical protein
VTITNTTTGTHDYYVYVPGRYSSSIQIPWNASGDALDSYYVFLNGIYYFTGGNDVQITGGHISNTSTGLPHYVNGLGATDLPDATDGTNGIEFVFDSSSFFSASNSAMPGASYGGASIFFVAPSIAATGTNNIAFFIGANDTATTAWSNQGFDASTSTAPRFQVWGTIFDASAGGTTVYLRAAQVGPHNLSPTDSNSSGQYAVNGEFIGYTMTLDMGSVYGNANGAPPVCSGGNAVWSNRGTPGLLVQFNPAFAPQAGVNSSLVK